MPLEGLVRRIDRVINLDQDVIISNILKDAEFQRFIIDLNTEGQLFEKGIDSLGASLQGKSGVNWLVDGEYAPFTVAEKQRKGQRYDHPTLKNKGDFYKSFALKVQNGGFLMTANFNVTSDEGLGANLLDVMKNGEKVVGLTDENLQIVIDAIKDKLIPIILTAWNA
jgi:hypothetical protein